jgi:hypothetical protein
VDVSHARAVRRQPDRADQHDLRRDHGQKVIPQLPVSGCGVIQSKVLAALGALRWDLVSVRLIAPIQGTTPTATAAPAVTGTPRSEQSVSAALPQ